MTSAYPQGVTASDHIAHDMRMKRFPEQSSIKQFLAERTAPPVVKPLQWIDSKAIGGGRKLVAMDLFGNEFARFDYDANTVEDERIVAFKKAKEADYEARIRSALSAPAVEQVGVDAYKAENAKRGWTGRSFAFDGGCLNLGRDGNAEFVFDMAELDPYYEEGKDLMLAKVPASEVEALRDLFVSAFPALAAPAEGDDAKDKRIRELEAKVATVRRETLEEAAKVAETYTGGGVFSEYRRGRNAAASDIRTLGGEHG